MKITVFGGSGFVGSHVADILSEAKHHVTIVDICPSQYLRTDQKMIVGSILDQNIVKTAISDSDVVYNFAGIADLDDARTRPIDTVTQNILGNTIILDACKNINVKRFVYASTVYVYSEKGGFYRCSKQAAETYIEEFSRQYGLEYTILRYGTLYGPRADHHNSIYRYLHQALTSKQISVSGHGNERREYIHVRDAARLSLQILKDDFKNKHITITGHQSIRFRDLLNIIKELLENKVNVEYLHNGNPAHYEFTPCSYAPKAGYKLTSDHWIDLSQGLLECLAIIDAKIKQ